MRQQFRHVPYHSPLVQKCACQGGLGHEVEGRKRYTVVSLELDNPTQAISRTEVRATSTAVALFRVTGVHRWDEDNNARDLHRATLSPFHHRACKHWTVNLSASKSRRVVPLVRETPTLRFHRQSSAKDGKLGNRCQTTRVPIILAVRCRHVFRSLRYRSRKTRRVRVVRRLSRFTVVQKTAITIIP